MRLPPILQKVINTLHEDRQAALRGLRSDIQQLISTIRDQKAADRQECQADYLETNLPERIIRAEREINKYAQREERTYRKLEISAQYFLVIGTWLAFLAAFVYAGVATYQWREMTRAATAAQSAADTAANQLELSEPLGYSSSIPSLPVHSRLRMALAA